MSDPRERLDDKKDVPGLCTMCVHAAIQTFLLKSGRIKERVHCCHPKDSGTIVGKVVTCNLFELKQLAKEPKRKKP